MHIKEAIIEIHLIDLKNAKLNEFSKLMVFALNKKNLEPC